MSTIVRHNMSVKPEKKHRKIKVSTALIHAVLILLVIINLFPLYWMLTFSLKSNDEIQGYSRKAEKTRWEEVEASITGIIGDVSDIEWSRVRTAAAGSVTSAVGKIVPPTETERKNAWVNRISEDMEAQWDDIVEGFVGIEGIFADGKTDEDWDRIRTEAEGIINDKLAASLTETWEEEEPAEGVEPTEAAEPARVVFAFSNNKWGQFKSAVERITVAEVTGEDPWEAVKGSIANVMGNEAYTLDEPETIYIPPNHVGLPSQLHWENYSNALKTGNMGQYFLNSLIVSVSAILITILAAFMATYAMTRLVWKGRKTMNKFFMLGLTIPIHAAIVPVFVILSRMNLLNTYIALIIPYAAFSLSMAILISVGFMGDIPYDLDEAAYLDGCGVWGTFFRVILPLMVPAISTVGIYTFLQCWNELLFATIFVSSGSYRTLPVGVQQLFGQYTTDWGPIGAALAIATIPTMIVYILLSRRIQEGFIAGAVKG